MLLLNLIIISFLSPILSNTYDLKKYDSRFQKFGVYNVLEKEVALDKAQNIISFFKSKSNLDNTFFSENEISHLYDVKNILQKSKTTYYFSLFLIWSSLIILAFLDKKNYFINLSNTTFSLGLIILVMITLFLVLYYLFGFKFVFEKFHHVFFTGNYAFDPHISNLKKLFPDIFFYDVSRTILFSLITQSIFFLVMGYVIKKVSKKKLK